MAEEEWKVVKGKNSKKKIKFDDPEHLCYYLIRWDERKKVNGLSEIPRTNLALSKEELDMLYREKIPFFLQSFEDRRSSIPIHDGEHWLQRLIEDCQFLLDVVLDKANLIDENVVISQRSCLKALLEMYFSYQMFQKYSSVEMNIFQFEKNGIKYTVYGFVKPSCMN